MPTKCKRDANEMQMSRARVGVRRSGRVIESRADGRPWRIVRPPSFVFFLVFRRRRETNATQTNPPRRTWFNQRWEKYLKKKWRYLFFGQRKTRLCWILFLLLLLPSSVTIAYDVDRIGLKIFIEWEWEGMFPFSWPWKRILVVSNRKSTI